MLVEIPELDVILGVILAFVVGVLGLYAYFKMRPYIKTKEVFDATQVERLEYYERQLIDMKIRLDAIEIQGVEQKGGDPSQELKQILEELVKTQAQKEPAVVGNKDKVVPEKTLSQPDTTNITLVAPIDCVLHLITNKSMTSRDIQITLQKSREHTSRLMKKMFEDGYVQRNTQSKPYTYSITEKGLAKVKQIQVNPIAS